MNTLPNLINGYKISPFANWENSGSLDWWTSFTKLKHNRLINIQEASIEKTVKALSALFIVISYRNEIDFKEGKISTELYDIFFPKYWRFKGRKMPGIILWE